MCWDYWKACSFVLFYAVTCIASIVTSCVINTTGVLAVFPRKYWCKGIEDAFK